MDTPYSNWALFTIGESVHRGIQHMGAVVNDMLNPFETALGSFWLCYPAHMVISKSNLNVDISET